MSGGTIERAYTPSLMQRVRALWHRLVAWASSARS